MISWCEQSKEISNLAKPSVICVKDALCFDATLSSMGELCEPGGGKLGKIQKSFEGHSSLNKRQVSKAFCQGFDMPQTLAVLF